MKRISQDSGWAQSWRRNPEKLVLNRKGLTFLVFGNEPEGGSRKGSHWGCFLSGSFQLIPCKTAPSCSTCQTNSAFKNFNFGSGGPFRLPNYLNFASNVQTDAKTCKKCQKVQTSAKPFGWSAQLLCSTRDLDVLKLDGRASPNARFFWVQTASRSPS